MDKDSIVNALEAIQGGANAAAYHDALEVALGVLMETSEEMIAVVVADIHAEMDDSADPEN
ncbi:MAG: hypothetical protein LBQ15_07735 [Clostridium sp.]|jgi:hypothetical protein|nr:hypothetical protein [Clostridium sp.]